MVCISFNSIILSEKLLDRAPVVNVVVTETGVNATGIGSTDLLAARVRMETKSPREATAESHRSAAGGAETAGLQTNLCVVSPA